MIDEISSCFKAYDIRGIVDVEINKEISFRIGYATAKKLAASKVVVGFDARESSPKFSNSVIEGIKAYGADVIKLGLAGTEEVYFAVANFGADAGIEVTASHNPINYNGMKIVKAGSQPLTADEFFGIKLSVEKDNFQSSKKPGQVKDFKKQSRAAYIDKILNFISLKNLKPLKIVLNSGNGAAGPVVDELENYLKQKGIAVDFVRFHHEPDPSFPNGIPNPLIERNRFVTSEAVKKLGADFGVAFDGDFDRCFLFDHNGNFVPTECLVSILAEVFLKKNEADTVIHDTRLVWNTLSVINSYGGTAITAKTGHVFFKETMRKEMAIYGGEISAHHYFRDFFYCDSGMIPWLIIWELLSNIDLSLADLVARQQNMFPSSGELNFNVSNPSSCLENIKTFFEKKALQIDETDGISLTFEDWRFNLRKSNTEPLVRLNVETRGNTILLNKKTKEIKNLILKTDNKII